MRVEQGVGNRGAACPDTGICAFMIFIYINMPNCCSDIRKPGCLYVSMIACVASLIITAGLNHFPCVPIQSAVCFGVAIVGTGYVERKKNYEPIWMYECIQVTSTLMGGSMIAYGIAEIRLNSFTWVSSVIVPILLFVAWLSFAHWAAMDHATSRIEWHTASSSVSLKELEMNPVAEAKEIYKNQQEELYEDEQKEAV